MKPKNSRKKLLTILFINFLLTIVHPVLIYSQIAFRKFENRSNYEGVWKLESDIPNFIASYLREKFEIYVLSPNSLENELMNADLSNQTAYEFIQTLGCNFLITGKIQKFSISRFTAGEPKLAGYEAYSNEISIELTIIDLKEDKIVFADNFLHEISDLGAGITIFGRESEGKKEFYKLDQIKFGSSEFMNTIVGKNLIKLCEDFSEKTNTLFLQIKSKKSTAPTIKEENSISFSKRILRGEILIVDRDTKEVFINLGSHENITPGTILTVYAKGDTLLDSTTNQILGIADKRIGEIEIVEVRGERFSLGLIKSEIEPIFKGAEVRKILILPK